jgi:cobalt-zinc-cadmium efflux system outer membrane protein
MRSIATVITIAASMTSPAWASEPVTSLSMHDAIELALQRNPDSRSAAEDVIAASGALHQSRLLPNPSLFMSSLGRGVSPAEGPVPNQFGVTWTIPIGGKRAAGIESAEAAVDAARATHVAARRQVALAVVKAFITVLLDQSLLEFALKDAAGIHQALELNELRYKDGKIPYGDVAKLRIQVYGLDDAARQTQLQLANDRAELARLTGEGSLASGFTVVGSLTAPALASEPVAENLYAQALKQRTDYLALIAQEHSLAASSRQARRTPIPDLGVLADYDAIPGSSGAYDLQLTVSIPIFDRNQGNIAQAEAAERKARIATEGLRAQIRSEVEQAVNTWNANHARLAVYDANLLAAAQESLEISRHTYEEGRGSLLDYLDAESTHRTIESAYRSAIADAMTAAAMLRIVAGEDLT